MGDATKSMISIFFVFIYLNIHLKSCFLSFIGITIILLSFPVTVIITNWVLQVKYFGFLQVIIVYIVLGIAADDIFVFYDAWVQSKHIDPKIIDSQERRLAYSFRRAVRAMAITSSTTSVAFFANIIS